jgi:hypothetical protein
MPRECHKARTAMKIHNTASSYSGSGTFRCGQGCFFAGVKRRPIVFPECYPLLCVSSARRSSGTPREVATEVLPRISLVPQKRVYAIGWKLPPTLDPIDNGLLNAAILNSTPDPQFLLLCPPPHRTHPTTPHHPSTCYHSIYTVLRQRR